MPSRHLSIRIDPKTYEQLAAQGRRSRETVSELSRRLIEEGLRMQGHPGSTFREAPTGRRPGLTNGPSVWVVARVVRDRDLTRQSTIDRAVKLTGLEKHQVLTALRYYAEYKQEVDDWMDRLDREAEAAEDAWLRERKAVGV